MLIPTRRSIYLPPIYLSIYHHHHELAPRSSFNLQATGCNFTHQPAQAYETFVKDTNKSIEEKSRADLSKAEAEVDLTAKQEAKTTALNEQQELKNEEADLHKSAEPHQLDSAPQISNGRRNTDPTYCF